MRAEGLACPIRWWEGLPEPTPEVLGALESALQALRPDPAAVLVTRAAFRGRAEVQSLVTLDGAGELVRFVASLCAGVRGSSRDGRRVTLELRGRAVVVSVGASAGHAVLTVIPLEKLVAALPGLERAQRAIEVPSAASLAAMTAPFRELARQSVAMMLLTLA